MKNPEFLAITCSLLKARGAFSAQGAIGLSFVYDWLRAVASSLSQSVSEAIAIALLLLLVI